MFMKSGGGKFSVDLFAGAGGLSLGFARLGFENVVALDNDEYACRSYKANIGGNVLCRDIQVLTGDELRSLTGGATGDVTVVCGGPPCQGFSIQRRGTRDDPRNDLLLHFVKLAIAVRPKFIVFENVPTLLGSRGREYVRSASLQLSKADYEVHASILEAADFQVPQFRRRAIIVAKHSSIRKAYLFPEPFCQSGDRKNVWDAISDLPPPPDDYSEHPDYANHIRVRMSGLNLRRLSFVPEGGGRADIPRELQMPCHKAANGHRHLDVFGRMRWDRPAPTITAMFDNFTRGRFAHPVENRNITGREGARLQSFPDEFVFIGPKKDVARQIGNAVPPLMATALAGSILRCLE
jgi:DNA (cytosine-5)-methyltransferase 1